MTNKELCPKYCARVVENVKVSPSPLWLQNKLRQVGIRSINNIVDVTNYVMMELGQPLHAFDASLLCGGIVVRLAKKGEKIAALDDNTYQLDSARLVIADKKNPVAIAGVMGGAATAVRAGTKTIVLEAAVFDSVSVRRTARALGLRSESSMRFEKGVDNAAVEAALNLAARMIGDLAGGEILRGIVAAGAAGRSGGRSVKTSSNKITALLGLEISAQKIKSILQSLGFTASGAKAGINVKVPSWRPDVTQAPDIAEEIGRMLNYNTLPKTLPSGLSVSPPDEPAYARRQEWRRFLTAAGYSEILTYSFYDEKLLALSGVKESEHIVVTNPVNAENKYLRANLLPALLSKLSQNSAQLSREQFCLFEIGKVFVKPHTEKWQLAAGLIDTAASDEVIYRRLRGLSELGDITIYPQGQVPNMRFRSSAGVLLLDLDEAAAGRPPDRRVFTPLPFYPQIERDLAMIVPEAVQYKQIEEAIKKHDPLLKAVALFDVYHGLGEGVSLAFRLTFSSTERTLESGEVDEVMERLKEQLSKRLKVLFR